MKPVSPVVPGLELPVTVYAKDQPQYTPLPCYREADGCITTRWHLTWKERFQIFLGGNLWLQVLTFHKPLQTVKLSAECPISSAEGNGTAGVVVA